MTEATELAPAKIISPKERSKSVPLDWPVEWNGKTYDEVVIRRITAREVDDFLAAVAAWEEGQPKVMLPVFDVPREVYDAMDDDDRLMLETEALPFMPRRLRVVVESTPENSSEKSSEE